MFEDSPIHSGDIDEQKELLAILDKGVAYWNKWRQQHSKFNPHFSKVNLSKRHLENINFKRTYLGGADFTNSNLSYANLKGAYLAGGKLNSAILSHSSLRATNIINADLTNSLINNTDLRGANIRKADLVSANLRYSNFTGCNLTEVDLTNADLRDCDLRYCTFIRSNLTYCNLSNSMIYGVSIWDSYSEKSIQENLVITEIGDAKITLDTIELAQFMYLMLNNSNLRKILDTVSSKAVLILGRFTPERKKILDRLRISLRRNNYVSILFDFVKPDNRDLTETISTLAHISKFVIVDLTEAKSVPQELMAIVPNLPSVSVQPVKLKGHLEYGMFEHFEKYPWVKPIIEYEENDSNDEVLITKILQNLET